MEIVKLAKLTKIYGKNPRLSHIQIGSKVPNIYFIGYMNGMKVSYNLDLVKIAKIVTLFV